MITCAICQREFKSMITSKHLKTHQITVNEYKEKFGDVVTAQYRKLKSQQSQGESNPNYNRKWTNDQKAQMSQKKKGSIPWNRGSEMPDELRQSLSQQAVDRYQRLKAAGVQHPAKGRRHDQQTREKIKQARANQQITDEQVQKALQTKRDRGYDLGFFRGKKHSQESLIKMQIARSKGLERIKKRSHDIILENLRNQDVSLVSGIDNTVLTLSCNICDSRFNITKQYCRGAKLKIELCPVCYPKNTGTSQAEQELAAWIKGLGFSITQNDRSIIPPLELDIFIPEHGIAIEYCGLYWHSDQHKTRGYHREKWDLCHAAGIRLVTIFEDEWQRKREIVESKLMNLLKLTTNRLSARKCQIRYIESDQSGPFLDAHHLQGAGRSSVKLGAYHGDILVAVMTFSKRNLSRRNDCWEIDRFCVHQGFHINGVASKLWKRFLTDYQPPLVISYSDLRWGMGRVYSNCGFELESLTVPSYWYFMLPDVTRWHRFTLRKTSGDRQDLTESALRNSQGWSRIWDCGNAKWVYKTPTPT